LLITTDDRTAGSDQSRICLETWNRPKRPHKLLGFSAFKRAKTPQRASSERALYAPPTPRQYVGGNFPFYPETGERNKGSRAIFSPAVPGGNGHDHLRTRR